MTSLRAKISGQSEEEAPAALGTPSNAGAEIEPSEPAQSAVGSREAPIRTGNSLLLFAVTLALFWAGAAGAYLWGFYGFEGLGDLGPHLIAFAAIVTFLPPFLFIACAFALARAQTMVDTAKRLAAAADRLTGADERAVENTQRLGRAVRRELDALSNGLDTAFNRMRALENVLEERVAQLDDANARAEIKSQAIAQRLQDERQGIEELTESIEDAAGQASETLAGRAAQLKTLIEQVGEELRAAGQLLETQSAQFRESAAKAAEAPFSAAAELDRQAKQIETAADKAVSRAEFVLGRQERQRTGMNELVQRLNAEGVHFEKVLKEQRAAIQHAAEMLSGEAEQLDALTERGLGRIESTIAGASERAATITAGFGRDADHIKSAAEGAAAAMSKLIASLREATTNAQELLDQTTADAKQRSKNFVGEAMDSSDRLLRAAARVTEQSEVARAALAKAAEEAERHIVAIPGLAQQEAQRVREMMRGETEKMLDMSARTLATLRKQNPSRSARQEGATDEQRGQEPIGEGLRGVARRMTAPRRRNDAGAAKSRFELSDVLAAAETPDDKKPALRPNAISALGSLQAALSDLASDLDTAMDESDSPELWRRYLAGDRGVFARKFANSIGPETVDRITQLYRDNSRFHAAADAYLEEFETLLARARESDRDGFLASTLLSADTGKIYLVVAYSLGRLE
jgi:hypothetical protein